MAAVTSTRMIIVGTKSTTVKATKATIAAMAVIVKSLA
jgi:hypothetical protein